MDYEETTKYILNLRRHGDIKLGFERIQYMLDRLGNPEKKLKFVHVGGTTGKGSTAAMISSILSTAGYKAGAYTSPHLSDYRERITIKGRKIPEEDVLRLFEELSPIEEKIQKEINEGITFFEFTTALALKYFSDNNVDIAVMEVGLGGRLDATNLINPIASVITNIGLEHTDLLGDTKEKIAYEKAGIIKQGGNLVTAPDDEAYEIFDKKCKELGAKIYRVGTDIKVNGTGINSDYGYQTFNVEGFGKQYNNVDCRLIGNHQLLNAGCAFGVANILNQNGLDISEDSFRKGLRDVVWPGRLEIMQRDPMILLDCAKDPLGMVALRSSLENIFKHKKLITIIGISSDKEIPLMLDQIVPISDTIIATRHSVGNRSFGPDDLAQIISKYGKSAIVAYDVSKAIDIAVSKADKDDLICITGSLFLVGEARERWHKEVVIWGREMNEGAKR